MQKTKLANDKTITSNISTDKKQPNTQAFTSSPYKKSLIYNARPSDKITKYKGGFYVAIDQANEGFKDFLQKFLVRE